MWGLGRESKVVLKRRNRDEAQMGYRGSYLVCVARSSQYEAPEQDRKFSERCSKGRALRSNPDTRA